MKIRSKLPMFFKVVFGLLELFFIGLTLFHLGLFFALPHISHPVSNQISRHTETHWLGASGASDYNFNYAFNLATVALIPDTGPLIAETHDTQGEGLSLNNVQATISLKNPAGDASLISLSRWAALSVAVGAAYMAVVFDFLRRLSRNVERGESFTERSVSLIQKIGLAIIVFSLIFTVTAAWNNNKTEKFLKGHVTVKGMSLTRPPDDGFVLNLDHDDNHFGFRFDMKEILTGLLILCLGEVFRQGLLLKKDNELTI